jgi:ribosomal protein S18 acetylase RimI-like enzyme
VTGASGDLELHWRSPNDGDAAAWARLREAVEATDRTGETLADEDVAEELHDPETDPARHAWFAFTPGGDAIAWGWITYASAPTRHHRVFLDGAVHPAWRGRGVGHTLVGWLVARGTEIVREFGGDLPAWLELRADARDAARARLFDAYGFHELRHFLELRRDLSHPVELSDPAPASGVTIAGYRRDLDEEVRVAHNEAFRDQWGSEERDRAAWDKWFTGSRHFRGDLSFVAHDDDAIAGYALSAVFEEDAPARGFTEAWTTHLGVRRPWRGHGVASALLTRCLGAYASAGYEFASLDVDGENPSGAVGIYRRLGYETARDVVSWALPVTRS